MKVYRAGERIVDRMEFEELTLKSIDLSIYPPLAHFKSTPVSDNEKASLSVSTTPFVSIVCIDALNKDPFGVPSIFPFSVRGSFGATRVYWTPNTQT
jgi:hypothetical protein